MKNRSEYNRIYATKRRTKEREKEFSKIFDLLGGRCAYCGTDVEFSSFHIEHVQAKHNGGKDKGNRTVSCRLCNSRKTRRDLEQYRAAIIMAQLEMPRISETLATYLSRLDFDVRKAEAKLISTVEYLFWFEQQGLTLDQITV